MNGDGVLIEQFYVVITFSTPLTFCVVLSFLADTCEPRALPKGVVGPTTADLRTISRGGSSTELPSPHIGVIEFTYSEQDTPTLGARRKILGDRKRIRAQSHDRLTNKALMSKHHRRKDHPRGVLLPIGNTRALELS